MNTSHYPSLALTRKLPREICNSGYGYAECQVIGNTHNVEFVSKEEFYDITKAIGNKWISLNWIFIECPSIMEMIDIMPDSIHDKIGQKNWLEIGKKFVAYSTNGMAVHMVDGLIPNALAEMILWLHENNYIYLPK